MKFESDFIASCHALLNGRKRNFKCICAADLEAKDIAAKFGRSPVPALDTEFSIQHILFVSLGEELSEPLTVLRKKSRKFWENEHILGQKFLTESLNPAKRWSFPSAAKIRIPQVPARRCQFTTSISFLSTCSVLPDFPVDLKMSFSSVNFSRPSA